MLPLLTIASTGAAKARILTQVILIVTRGGLPVQKERFGLVEDRGEVERERYAPLFPQAYCAGLRGGTEREREETQARIVKRETEICEGSRENKKIKRYHCYSVTTQRST